MSEISNHTGEKRNRGRIIQTILETLSEATYEMAGITAAILEAGYGASTKKIQRARAKREERHLTHQAEQELRQKCAKMISYLKADGLVADERKEGKRIIRITARGTEWLKKLQKRTTPLRVRYERQPATGLVIVAFDIPEPERAKRAWLRFTLSALDFSMIQKSVWIGRHKLPDAFLADAERFNCMPYLEIFEVSKSGTLRKLTAP